MWISARLTDRTEEDAAGRPWLSMVRLNKVTCMTSPLELAVPSSYISTATETRIVRYRRSGLEIAELFFDDDLPEPLPAVDLLRYVAVPEPTSDRAWIRRNMLSVDVTLPEDELLQAMGRNTRYKIRRAMRRDRLHVETFDSPTPEVVATFTDYYDEFASSKALRPIFRPRLYAMADSGTLLISRVSREGMAPLAWHAYAVAAGHALLLYSASHFRRYKESAERNMIGRANRYLHWHDMLWCKAAGYESYDLGGINLAGEDPATRRVTEFKLGLGGRPQPTHMCTTAVSARGRLAKTLLRLRRIDL
jgi:hypothetical protein